MKRIKSFTCFCLIACLFSLTTCKKKDTSTTPNYIVPTSITVPVPSSLNSNTISQSFHGQDIYQSLRGLVWIGESAANIIDQFCYLLEVIYDVTKISTVTITGSDGLSKTITITSKPTHNGVAWDWEMNVTDFDGSKALEFFWNESPLKGVAIYQAYKLNHTNSFSVSYSNAMVQIDYSEAEPGYSKQMIVTIDSISPYSSTIPNKLKMFVGQRKTDGLLDIYGNCNIPNAIMINPSHTGGFQWTFVAHSNPDLDLSVARISLPPCNYTLADTSLWGTYSLYNVLKGELKAVSTPDTTIAHYLQFALPPAYYIKTSGFLSCGPTVPVSPAGFTLPLCDLSSLIPFIPNDVRRLKVIF